MSSVQPFEPAKFLTNLKGSDYLEVRWRLVWLRDRHPDAAIETELISHQNDTAIFRARVSLPDGGSATGWAKESKQTFTDYVEKCETSAIGRALAALGYGTQFCNDHDFGASQGRVVDAPVKRPPSNGSERPAVASASLAPEQTATQRQLRYMQAVAREAGIDAQALDEMAQREFGMVAMALSRRDASAIIDIIQNQQTEVPLGRAPTPLSDRVRNGRESAPAQEAAPATKPAATPGNPPTDKQWGYLERLRGELSLERPEVAEFFSLRYGYDIDNADRADLSNLIDAMKGVIDGAHTLESIMVRVAPLETAAAPVAAVTGNAGGVPWDDLPPIEPTF